MIVPTFIYDGYFEIHSFHTREILIELTRKQLTPLFVHGFERFSLNCHSRMHYGEEILLPCRVVIAIQKQYHPPLRPHHHREIVFQIVSTILEHVVEERLSNERIWSNSVLSSIFRASIPISIEYSWILVKLDC